jgi:hypothetical protein
MSAHRLVERPVEIGRHSVHGAELRDVLDVNPARPTREVPQ